MVAVSAQSGHSARVVDQGITRGVVALGEPLDEAHSISARPSGPLYIGGEKMDERKGSQTKAHAHEIHTQAPRSPATRSR